MENSSRPPVRDRFVFLSSEGLLFEITHFTRERSIASSLVKLLFNNRHYLNSLFPFSLETVRMSYGASSSLPDARVIHASKVKVKVVATL